AGGVERQGRWDMGRNTKSSALPFYAARQTPRSPELKTTPATPAVARPASWMNWRRSRCVAMCSARPAAGTPRGIYRIDGFGDGRGGNPDCCGRCSALVMTITKMLTTAALLAAG